MSIAAVFIDGLYKTELRMLPGDYPLPNYRMPRFDPPTLTRYEPSNPPTFSEDIFNLAGRLPDGRVVYTLAGIPLKLWSVGGWYTKETALRQDDATEFIRKQLYQHIEAIVLGRFVELFDETKWVPAEYAFRRTIMGVGLQRPVMRPEQSGWQAVDDQC